MATTHYVCTGGCLTVKYAPGRCITPGCYRHRNPLTECLCEDGAHGDLLHRNDTAYRVAQQTALKKSPAKRTKKKKA